MYIFMEVTNRGLQFHAKVEKYSEIWTERLDPRKYDFKAIKLWFLKSKGALLINK